jgi:activator of HSP90 ATPase
VRSNSVEPDIINFSDISPLEEIEIYREPVEMMEKEIYEDVLNSVSSVLDFFKESVVKSGYI